MSGLADGVRKVSVEGRLVVSDSAVYGGVKFFFLWRASGGLEKGLVNRGKVFELNRDVKFADLGRSKAKLSAGDPP